MIEAIRTLSVNSSEVLAKYREIDKPPLDNIERMIELYPIWHPKVLTVREIGQLIWYFDKTNPNHISWKLTRSGKARRVENVAEVYLSLGSETLIPGWNNVHKVESMISWLKNGGRFPPIIIVQGNRYPDSPECSFIDGVHRSLALMVYDLTVPNNKLEINAYVGEKANILSRAIRRIG